MASKTTLNDSNPPSTIKDKAFSGLGNLVRLLPTGTVFMFQFLNPVLTNNGHCHLINKYLSGALIGLCGLSCFLSSFTDSYAASDGSFHYGIATLTGLWPAGGGSGSVDLSKYRIRPGDFVHALISAAVFALLSLFDSNTVECFYPSFERDGKMLLMVLPPVIGAVSGSVFMMFPNKRHGIGYPNSAGNKSACDGNESS
ncbi:hypothetical protein SAY86_007786 [Trapa natans]|uniref:DUF679 domain membrane protein 2 n=1 Tax=Trapa natans TaxID=22666 RepID=A0AAN7LPL1_TRANT|nr:hypothetical protein SAY86_007786 [Trapa natans]